MYGVLDIQKKLDSQRFILAFEKGRNDWKLSDQAALIILLMLCCNNNNNESFSPSVFVCLYVWDRERVKRQLTTIKAPIIIVLNKNS